MRIRTLPYVIYGQLPWFSKIKNKFNCLHKKENTQKANAEYCYSVWLRHLSILGSLGLDTTPRVVAELGPGDSIGVGLMALLTGSEKYFAFDCVDHTSLEKNVGVLEELAYLLSHRVDIPHGEAFSRVKPSLSHYDFPHELLDDAKTSEPLLDNKKHEIKNVLLGNGGGPKERYHISYYCPWYGSEMISEESVDLVYSQSVLEYVDLNSTYEALFLWLKHGGLMSHQVDLSSCGMTEKWNAHWSYSDFEWDIITKNRAYSINREPLTRHIEVLNKVGFKIIKIIPSNNYPEDKYSGSICRTKLSKRFQDMSEEDFTTCSAHIVAIKE